MAQPAILALEDGSIFQGRAIGAVGSAESMTVGEIVFNTAMTGYQEILSDPSYTNQMITLTYPHIGNVGVNAEDLESRKIYAKGLIIRELPIMASNWRKQQSLDEFLKAQNVLGIRQIDTRRLTRIIREKGALNGCILTAKALTDAHRDKALQMAKKAPSMKGCDLASLVSTETPYTWQGGGTWVPSDLTRKVTEKRFHVVAYDFGIKHSILRTFDDLGFKVTVVPARTPLEDVLNFNPHGIFLSNGPGDPEPCTYAIETARACFAKKIPVFGICLGFQILSLALGAKTFKMKFGHHGGNHPVESVKDKTVLITSQNHGFAVDEMTLPSEVEVTHRSLFDGTIQGIQHKTLPVFGFQGHPEAGPGPQEAKALFQNFVQMLDKRFAPSKDALVEM